MADDTAPLASLSLTHVHYDPKDPLSHASAFLALVPQALCVAFASLLYATREIEILLMFAGQMGSELCNWLLKRLIKEERPRRLHGKGYGMPSSHAQFTAFFAVYLALFLLVRHAPHETRTITPLGAQERALVASLAIIGASLVAVSRIYLGYHTLKQVLVGVSAGTVLAVVWFSITTYLRRGGWIEWMLDLSIAKALRLRDLVVEEDLADAGWVRWQERNRKRSLKVS